MLWQWRAAAAAAGKIAAALGYAGLITGFQAVDEITDLRDLGCVTDFLHPGVLLPVEKIIQDRAAEQKCFLRNIANLIPKFPLRHMPDVAAVNTDRPALDVVEPGNQAGDRGLSGTGASNNCRRLALMGRKS